ncbi:Methyltransferase domain-containing protein [Cnuella takakiae]|uniref:Methyltransferase domain-containing protein n=1 Tax=Cnuella takakiae TaxID=1302690 RepID=A0A1M5I5B3_9BACT|nr:class I SAM-dependent methyltransferase [Cnuella takakiae]OLY93179.1 SAM-dependent methyltransferase [Cnuella takakiae]SHG23475.1 Methyltransferase domain-containing protein [Cnuella takakiae]
MKDLFSGHSAQYAQYRPGYPPELFQWLADSLPAQKTAWDCGTGNGQVATLLAPHFEQVFATDISSEQLAQAPKVANITYSQQPAEHTNIQDLSIDLVTVAQAIHWFDLTAFFTEVNRVARPGARLLVLGYGLLQVNENIDALIKQLYTQVLGPYWAHERRLIDEGYKSIPFPFTELTLPQFPNLYQWNLQHLLDYLRTWSAVKQYQKVNGTDPVTIMKADFSKAWGPGATATISFPLIGRLGVIDGL